MEICAVFLDLQKAFDSVPHQNLLHIMKQMDIHPLLLAWTCSYLTGRSQRVVVDSATSSEVHAKSGVLQGSVHVLGPLLFLIYILTYNCLLSHALHFMQMIFYFLNLYINKVEDYI